MMKTVLLMTLLSSMIAPRVFADSTLLTCQNGNAKLTLTQTANGVTFSINGSLAQNLTAQGKQVQTAGIGRVYSNEPCTTFSAGAPHGYSLSLTCDHGGQLFTYTDYTSFAYGRPAAKFYFNPGECR